MVRAGGWRWELGAGGGVAPFTVAVLSCEMKASYNYSLRAASGFQLNFAFIFERNNQGIWKLD